MHRPVAIVVFLGLLVPSVAAAEAVIDTFGDARIAFFANQREARDGTETTNEGVRLRLRVGAQAQLSDAWLLRGRLAGRFSTDQDEMGFWLKAWAPTRTGLEDGDVTVDEFFLRYGPAGADWSLRVGRFQSKFELMGVASKALDRNDSPNMEVTWTDGLHWQYALTPQWRSHLIFQSNASSGSGQAARAPLAFDDSASRITTFAALEASKPLGPLKQRLFAVTWMPSTLATEGIDAERREDYLAFTAKLFAEWPIGTSGMRGGLGGEAGYAPNTPRESVVGAGTGGSADGWARTFSMNLLDFIPNHHIAFVFGRAGAGWLISPDFRNNDRLLEIRYQWRLSKTLSMEARLRRREEIDLPPGVDDPRIDDDFYLRLSARF
jgi:hypothetical protein